MCFNILLCSVVLFFSAAEPFVWKKEGNWFCCNEAVRRFLCGILVFLLRPYAALCFTGRRVYFQCRRPTFLLSPWSITEAETLTLCDNAYFFYVELQKNPVVEDTSPYCYTNHTTVYLLDGRWIQRYGCNWIFQSHTTNDNSSNWVIALVGTSKTTRPLVRLFLL